MLREGLINKIAKEKAKKKNKKKEEEEEEVDGISFHDLTTGISVAISNARGELVNPSTSSETSTQTMIKVRFFVINHRQNRRVSFKTRQEVS